MLTTAVVPAGAVASTGAVSASGQAPATARHQHRPPKPTRSATRQFEATVRRDTAGLGHSSTTVTGPHLYDPATGKPFPDPSTVTVSQTSSMVNQMVQVSWTNFTPSSSLTYQSLNTYYPVMVTECKGTSPASPADCYGAENGGVTSTSGQFGPMNDAYATTAADGTGATDIDIFTPPRTSSSAASSRNRARWSSCRPRAAPCSATPRTAMTTPRTRASAARPPASSTLARTTGPAHGRSGSWSR
jgi:hypothetical protein